MRKPLFVVAFVFLTAVIGVELGASLFVQPVGVSTSALRSNLLQDGVDGDDIDDALDDLASRESDDPPGLAIPAMAMLDGMLWVAMAGILAALFVPANVLGRIVAPVNLIISILVILGGIVVVLFTIVLVFLMVGLFLAPPFGTIAYLARWGAFPRGDAQATMALVLVLKLAFCGFALAASARFLQQKALIVLVVLSFVVQLVVGFLQNLPPLPLVSITDAVGAIIAVIVAIVWAIWVLVGSLIGTIRIVRVKRA